MELVANSKYYLKEEEQQQQHRYVNHHHPPLQQEVDEERENLSSENSGDSPPSPTTFAVASSSSSSPKRGRRAIQKRVVTVPIKDVEGLRLKGDSITPPSDSWAWRKYGQKPIKGSPYPRGYYRCSSSKGCPARKQVERSRTSPSTLVITYSYEHNHPWPTSKSSHHSNHQYTTTSPTPTKTTTATTNATAINTTTAPNVTNSEIDHVNPMTSSTNITSTSMIIHDHHHNNNLPTPSINNINDKLMTDFGDESLITTDDFTWFSDMESMSSSSYLDCRSSVFTKTYFSTTTTSATQDCDVIARLFPMREEDESFFADLGELPECSTVFDRGNNSTSTSVVLEEDECRRMRCNSFATWCAGTTG